MLYIPLELLNVRDIRRYKQRYQAILDYYYEHYSFFQNERAKRFSAIKDILLKNTRCFNFSSWHRIFDFQYINNPLSARGSIVNDPGGRFNIGDIDELKFSKFPTLYIAENYEIAYRERNQILPNTISDFGLSSDELSLTNQRSTVDLLLEGDVKSVIDLTKENCLRALYEVIKDIKLPHHLEKKSRMLTLHASPSVRSYEELKDSILQDNWRELPARIDIPANSQIFGQLAHTSGVEGILYPSKMSDSKKCLAIYPKNFINSTSYVSIQDKNKPQNIAYYE